MWIQHYFSRGIINNAGAGGPTWTFISGPATPTIVSSNIFTTDVTGMTVDGAYVFRLSHACGTGMATSQEPVRGQLHLRLGQMLPGFVPPLVQLRRQV